MVGMTSAGEQAEEAKKGRKREGKELRGGPEKGDKVFMGSKKTEAKVGEGGRVGNHQTHTKHIPERLQMRSSFSSEGIPIPQPTTASSDGERTLPHPSFSKRRHPPSATSGKQPFMRCEGGV